MYINSVPLEDELRKNSGLKKIDVDLLKKWCWENHYQLDDSDVVIFLHKCFYNVETAKVFVQKYAETRRSLPQCFQDRFTYADELKPIIDTIAVIPLANRTREGYKVILVKPLFCIDRVASQCINFVKFFNMVLDVNIYEEGTNPGYIFVFDIYGINKTRPKTMLVRRYLDHFQWMFPIRLFSLHVVDTMFPFVKNSSFDKMMNRPIDYQSIFVHKNLNKLNLFVPLEILPNEMGGRAGHLSYLHQVHLQKLRHYFRI